MLKLILAASLTLAAAPAFAQSGATPPAPNAAEATPNTATSVPPQALNVNPSGPRNPQRSGALGGAAARGTNGVKNGPGGAFQKTVPAPASR